ncbi:MAG: hypothetical protein Q3988_00175 [Gemella sp.]|nr:hypothetical protein [Gemella sp.]
MIIRKAKINDIDEILEVFDLAKKIMRENGNHSQWTDGYPSKELLSEDINSGNLYVLEKDRIEAVFALIEGIDPTYIEIEGAWLDDKPYATLHRVASSGRVKGLFSKIIEFAVTINSNLKIDTHQDNSIMQRVVEKSGFKYCGKIYLEDGSPRLAYQKN